MALSDEGAAFYAMAYAGRKGSDTLFLRADGKPWQKTQQIRRLLEASTKAGIAPHARFHDLRHTYASQLAMRGVSLQVIAVQLGHSDTRICEKHYAHLSPSYVADTIKRHLPNLGGSASAKVASLAIR